MQIKRYEPKWRDDFVRLNRDWIEHYFRLEEADLHTLSAVEETILKPGGEIFLPSTRLSGPWAVWRSMRSWVSSPSPVPRGITTAAIS